MPEENQKPPKKVSTVESLIMIMLSLFFDLIEFLLALLLIGNITNSITNIIFSGTFAFWFFMKQIKLPTFIIGATLEFVPLINLLPIRTATVIITIMVANNPKLSIATKIAKPKPTR